MHQKGVLEPNMDLWNSVQDHQNKLFEIFIFCPKIQLWFPVKIVDLFGWMNELPFIAKTSFLYNVLLRVRRPSGAMKHEVFFSSGLNIGFLSKRGVMEKGPRGPKPAGALEKKGGGVYKAQCKKELLKSEFRWHICVLCSLSLRRRIPVGSLWLL